MVEPIPLVGLSESPEAFPFTVSPHKTLFGGVRSDIVVVEILLTNGLPTAWTLIKFVQFTLPNVTPEELETMLAFQAIYVSYLQLPLLQELPWGICRRVRRELSRYHEHIARSSSYNEDMSTDVPVLTRRVQRKFSTECILPKGTTAVRFHLKPLRFPIAPLLEWKSRILWENESFIAVDKPAGLPCEPVASNGIECLHKQVNEFLNINYLHPLHRIDLWTSGVVCLAKTDDASRLFNSWQQERRKIRKFYRALVSRPSKDSVPLPRVFGFPDGQLTGQIKHWMPAGAAFKISAPRVVSRSCLDGWKDAITEIISYRPLSIHDIEISDHPGAQLGWKEQMRKEINSLNDLGHEFWDVKVELVTGRTHQLRAQFASMGLPVVCDLLYQPLAGVTVDGIDHHRMCKELDFCKVVIRGEELDGISLSPQESRFLDCLKKTRQLSCPLALQSHEIWLPPHNDTNKIRLSSSQEENDREEELVPIVNQEPWWLGGPY